jgi:hypothetical protein
MLHGGSKLWNTVARHETRGTLLLNNRPQRQTNSRHREMNEGEENVRQKERNKGNNKDGMK